MLLTWHYGKQFQFWQTRPARGRLIAVEIQLESPDFGMDEALKISFEIDVKMLFGFGK